MPPTTRLAPGDVLTTMLIDLVNEGLTLRPWQADEITSWKANGRQLLAAVSDPIQRLAFRMSLAQALTCAPVAWVMQELE